MRYFLLIIFFYFTTLKSKILLKKIRPNFTYIQIFKDENIFCIKNIHTIRGTMIHLFTLRKKNMILINLNN